MHREDTNLTLSVSVSEVTLHEGFCVCSRVKTSNEFLELLLDVFCVDGQLDDLYTLSGISSWCSQFCGCRPG